VIDRLREKDLPRLAAVAVFAARGCTCFGDDNLPDSTSLFSELYLFLAVAASQSDLRDKCVCVEEFKDDFLAKE